MIDASDVEELFVDIDSIAAAYNSLKFAKDALKVSLKYKIEIEAREKVLAALEKLGDLQDTIFELQRDRAEQQTEIERLHDELNKRNDWEATKVKYDLEQTVGGAVVYTFTGLPKHYACPSCFSKNIIQILQDQRNAGGTFGCPGCKAAFPVKSFEIASGSVDLHRRGRFFWD